MQIYANSSLSLSIDLNGGLRLFTRTPHAKPLLQVNTLINHVFRRGFFKFMLICPICRKNNIYETKNGWKCVNCDEYIEPKKEKDVRDINKFHKQ